MYYFETLGRILIYLDHPLPLLPPPSAGSAAVCPLGPFSDHTVHRGHCLRMILVMIDAHIWFVHSREATKVIVKLVRQLILSG